MQRFILLYDCPIYTCDKIWLYEGLKKYGNVKLVETGTKTSFFRLSRKFPFKLGEILVRILIWIQCLRAIIISNKEDIIVTWERSQGVTMNGICNVLKIERKIVSFCWIELPVKRLYKKNKKCLENKKFIPIINNKSLEEDFKELFNLKKWNGFYLPDVFDDKEELIKPNIEKGNKYLFAGGINNRDWNILLSIARKTPNIKYIIVAGKNCINKEKIPNNVQYFEELPTKEYYDLMKKSYITICPLKENRVSGLINIIKSIQYGIPCITTDLDVTSIYYPEEIKKDLLFERKNEEELKRKIIECYSISKEKYIELATKLQKHLKENFNPNKNVKDLIDELKRRKFI